MSRQVLAIATCRVSSTEQLENNSLNRQRAAVLKAAEELDVTIPDDGWWSGSVSSKRGTNVERKDLNEMVTRCKKDQRIKYLIVDEPDRFMRSIDEAAFFEVTFKRLGVTVWYASDPELNKGDLASKLLKFTKYLSAEGSNEERQHKSVAGQTKALLEGRYPFSPKPGYKRGYERAIQEVDPVRGKILQAILLRIVTKNITPSRGLVELNRSDFVKGRAQYKMDKFRKIVADPYYAGIVEVDKQVKVRNENGLHEPLISKEQHYELLRIMDSKKKNQSGPPKNGNPKYPLSNDINCDICRGKRYSRFVGLDLNNGKNKALVYEKYRCRSCKRYLTRDEVHRDVADRFTDRPITHDGLDDFTAALDIVWKLNEDQSKQEVIRIRHKLDTLKISIYNQVEAATDPSNTSIKEEILASISNKKEEAHQIEEQLAMLDNVADADRERFIRFAFNFIKNMGAEFFDISAENRSRCKQLVFPAGFWVNEKKKVYTPEISPLYRLATNKKDTEASQKSLLVRVKRL